MNLEKFENLEKEKKERILESAMTEFNIHGYVGASTNNIVKNAEISKGSLFNYFENKDKLFMYIFSYNIEKVVRNFEENKDVLIKLNLIEAYKFFISVNIKFFTENPKVFQFLAKAITNSPEPIKILLQKRKREMQGFVINSIIKNVENSYFRENIDKEKVEFLILTLLDTLSNKYIEKYKGDLELLKADSENRDKEIEDYIDLIKFGILRSGEKWRSYFYFGFWQ